MQKRSVGAYNNHWHVFSVSSFELKSSGNGNEEIIARLRCAKCGVETTAQIKQKFDVVSIDGKLYFIPRDYSSFGPVPLTETDINPSVEYTKLASGLYVPVKYVSEEVMKKLEELDAEYSTRAMLRRMEQDEKDIDYNTFAELYKKVYDISIEQSTLLKDSLEENGFRLDAYINNKDLIVKIEKGNEESYFRVYNYVDVTEEDIVFPVWFGFRGKWSLLGTVVLKLVTAGVLKARRGGTTVSDFGPEIETLASIHYHSNAPVLIDHDGYVISPLAIDEILPNHNYLTKFVKTNGVYIALSYTPLHYPERVTKSTVYIEKGELVTLDQESMVCVKCKTVVFERPPKERRYPIDIISIDGTPYYVPKDDCWPLSKIENIAILSGIRVGVKYTELTPGLYVPLGYMNGDTAKRITNVADPRKRAELAVEELEGAGFRFSTKINRARNEVDVTVYGPDGSSSTYCAVGNQELYKGKWSLLGKAVLMALRR